jgi:hypothetical protein
MTDLHHVTTRELIHELLDRHEVGVVALARDAYGPMRVLNDLNYKCPLYALSLVRHAEHRILKHLDQSAQEVGEDD